VCGRNLEVGKFPPDRRNSTGLSSWCLMPSGGDQGGKIRTNYAERGLRRKR